MKNDVVENLFKQYYNNALLYTLSLAKDKQLAEDIVSTAFFKALKSVDGEISSFKPWLMRVCRNTYYDHFKRQKRQGKLDENIVDESEQAVDKIIRDERIQALYRALELIPEAQKEIVVLFYFENIKVDDIAKIVDKTPDNVKVMLYRARENLKKILEK